MNTNGIIFDFNGTLFWDTPFHVQAWDAISRRLGGPTVTPEMQATQLNGLNNFQILQMLVGNDHDASYYEQASKEKEALYRQMVAQVPGGASLAPGAVELFDQLKALQIPMTICSASIKENIDFFVETFHLDTWMDPATIVYDDGSYSSKTQMLLDATHQLNDPKSVLIFEDSKSGLTSAAQIPNASIIAIYYKHNESLYPTIPHLIKVIPDFTTALPVIRQWMQDSK